MLSQVYDNGSQHTVCNVCTGTAHEAWKICVPGEGSGNMRLVLTETQLSFLIGPCLELELTLGVTLPVLMPRRCVVRLHSCRA